MERNFFVVGGSSGVGREIVRQLSHGGDRIVATSRSQESVERLAGVTYECFDAGDPSPAINIPEKLDGLVYCPGTIQLKPFGRLSDEDFRSELEVNFFGAVRAIRLALPSLRRSESASIVLFSTVAASTGLPYHCGIASAKGALEGLARTLAAELAPKIRVNCLALSLTETPLAESLLATEEKRRASAKRHPLKRIGDAGEVAKAALFLLGAESGFITGQTLHIDGGLSTLKLL